MKIYIKNKVTDEIKDIQVGSSLTLFIFSQFFGIPLFLRDLTKLGILFVILTIFHIIGAIVQDGGFLFGVGIFSYLISVGLSIWLGIKGNKITAKNYLDNGWEFESPESDKIRVVKSEWNII